MGEIVEVPVEELDEKWMSFALTQAQTAAQADEVPVGALVVLDNQVVGLGRNCPIECSDPTGHAEIQAIRNACQHQQNYRLPGATLYITLEPCTMCLGAIIHSRIERIVFAATEPRAGAVVSAAALNFSAFNHSLKWTKGVLEDESAQMLKAFFRARRKTKQTGASNE